MHRAPPPQHSQQEVDGRAGVTNFHPTYFLLSNLLQSADTRNCRLPAMQLSMRASLLHGSPACATAGRSTIGRWACPTASIRARPTERRQQATAGRRAAAPPASAAQVSTEPAPPWQEPRFHGQCREVGSPRLAPLSFVLGLLQDGSGAAEEVAELKAALIDSFWGTERGLAASSDTRAEINELISQARSQAVPPRTPCFLLALPGP